MLSMHPTRIHTTQKQSHHQHFEGLLEQEMPRIRVAAHELRTGDRPPPRARTAPIRADKEDTPVTRRKRARSETIEPPRSSKRLRGIAVETIAVEEDDGADLRGGWVTGKKSTDSPKREFLRTISIRTDSTVPDSENRTPTSSRYVNQTPVTTEAPLSQDAPTNSQVSTSTIAPELEGPLQMPSSATPRPLYRNIPPLPVLINGHVSLRVVFRQTCCYRFRAPTPLHEWQSQHFFQQITDPAVRALHEKTLSRDGVIIIPERLFELSPETEPIIFDLIHEFVEYYALPNHSLPTFAVFTDPLTDILEPRRMCWWKVLADYFRVPHNFDNVFNTTPGNWHAAYHALPTFEGLRELSEFVENMGFKRAREMIHQEMARRIAYIKGKGDRKSQTLFRLLRKGYEELRELSKEYDRLPEGRFDGQAMIESCDMCRVRP